MRNLAVAALATLVAVAAWQLWVYRTGGDDPPGRGSSIGLTRFDGDNGITLPDVTGRTIAGKDLVLADLVGHVLVINVWGSWCAPCREEAPVLAAVSEETAERGVHFVGIDVRDTPAAANAFEAKYGITYPSLDDQSGLVLAQFTGIIPISAVPSTVVVDRDGIIRARVIGRVQRTTLERLIRSAAQQPPT